MAAVTKITYPDASGSDSAAAGLVQVTATRAEAAQAGNLSILLYEASGRFLEMIRLSDLFRRSQAGPDRVAFEWSAPLCGPDLGRRAVALLDVTGAPPVRSFVSADSAVMALDGPAAGSTSTVCTLSGADLCLADLAPPSRSPAEDDLDISGLAAGTLIETPQGDRAVETLAEGDLVTTWHGDAAPLRLVLARRVPSEALRASRRMWPVRIGAGAMGYGLPRRDLWVSPHHRMLYQSIKVPLMFGEDAVFVRAKSLAASFERVHVDNAAADITYFHLLFDDPQVIFAEGCATESAPPGPEALTTLSDADRGHLNRFVAQQYGAAPLDDLGWPTLRSWELTACVA